MPIYTVSQVATYLKELLETDIHLGDLWISGEVSNLSRSGAGHSYFTLKDAAAQLRCVLFRGQDTGFILSNGVQVVAHGRVSLYETRGDLQLYVDFVQPEGVGLLHAQFERLKTKLEAEGLFEPSRKRSLPPFPQRVGVVTSPYGSVFHDICHVVSRRWPLCEIVLAPTSVQGEEAAAGIVAALHQLNLEPDIDVIITARGGGSLEELWPFNEEMVARAIYASRVPVISGVGHETDTTIADLVADVRAPTPSAAAELAVPNQAELRVGLRRHCNVLVATMDGLIQQRRWETGQLVARLRRHPPSLERYRQQVDDALAAASHRLDDVMNTRRASVERLAAQLRSLNPAATLARGYALVQKVSNGDTIRSVGQVHSGDYLDVHVSDGHFPAEVAKQYGLTGRRR